MTMKGYFRQGKSFGIRNHLLIIPTVFCANNVVNQIADHFKDKSFGEHNENYCVAVNHGAGCCHTGLDETVAFRTLLGAAKHPNVGAVLLVSLGCGQFCCDGFQDKASNMVKRMADIGLVADDLNIQATGNTNSCIEQGIEKVEALLKKISGKKRTEIGYSNLTAAILNGGSDPTSGLFANPAVGHFTDAMIQKGGSAVFSQTSELLGAEEYFFKKTKKEAVAKLRNMIGFYDNVTKALVDHSKESEPTPGNINSGISTLTEKSMGNSRKIGHEETIQIQKVLAYSQKIPNYPGLYFMDGPGQDLLCMTGMLIGGSHLAMFTTGIGSPLGSALAPVIKITANKQTYDMLDGNMDVYIPKEDIFNKGKFLKDIAHELLTPLFESVVSGETQTKSEIMKQRDFGIRQMWLLL